jgi:hypothetical protein
VTFRDGLLNGRRIALVGDRRTAIGDQLCSLGAWVDSVPDPVAGDEEAAGTWVAARLPLGALVVDSGLGFGAGA